MPTKTIFMSTDTFKIGNRFKIKDCIFILTGFFIGDDQYFVLINLNDGNRWDDPEPIKDYDEITEADFNSYIGFGHEYELVN